MPASSPGSQRADAAWAYQFALGALIHHISDHRVGRLSRGESRPNDPAAATLFSDGPVASWIWGASNTKNYTLRKEFAAGSMTAVLKASCDNKVKLSLNGQVIGQSDEWQEPLEADVQKLLKPEGNVLVAEVVNEGGVAGLVPNSS